MISRLARLRAKKGFTLVEAIIVIAIIGILTAIIVPALSYSNKPALGKALAKDIYYKAQDALSVIEAANPGAITTSRAIFYADIDGQGNVTATGSVSTSGYTKSAFPATITVNSDATALNRKMKETFEEYLEANEGMEGTLYIVADKDYRVLVAYWTDDPDLGADEMIDFYIVDGGYYCCSYPVKFCDPGRTVFTDPDL